MKTIDLRVNQVFFFTLSNFKLFSHCSSTYCTTDWNKIIIIKKFKRTGLVDVSQKLNHHGNRLLLILLEILSSYFYLFIFYSYPLFSTSEHFSPFQPPVLVSRPSSTLKLIIQRIRLSTYIYSIIRTQAGFNNTNRFSLSVLR